MKINEFANELKELVEQKEDKEKYEQTFEFMKKQDECDEHNYNEMLKIEPSHLTKAKITTMLGLNKKWRKENNIVVSKYKEAQVANKKHKYCELIRKERQWYIIWS